MLLWWKMFMKLIFLTLYYRRYIGFLYRSYIYHFLYRSYIWLLYRNRLPVIASVDPVFPQKICDIRVDCGILWNATLWLQRFATEAIFEPKSNWMHIELALPRGIGQVSNKKHIVPCIITIYLLHTRSYTMNEARQFLIATSRRIIPKELKPQFIWNTHSLAKVSSNRNRFLEQNDLLVLWQ
jgi:hypothetical protein